MRQIDQLDAFFQDRHQETQRRSVDGRANLGECQASLTQLIGRNLLDLGCALAFFAEVGDRMRQPHLLRTEQKESQEQTKKKGVRLHDSGV
ncbi:MAG: hypothetical protein H7327_06345 [Herminiimonas sp.]|nr:hypothetical protein [Herminiimonas sp.]